MNQSSLLLFIKGLLKYDIPNYLWFIGFERGYKKKENKTIDEDLLNYDWIEELTDGYKEED